MKFKLFALVLTTAVLWTGCSSNTTELEGKIQETQQALTDTVTHFTDSIANLNFMLDSLSAELAKHSVQTRSGGTRSTTPKTTIPPPKKDPGKVNVTQKGGGGTGEEIKVDVTKKGGEGTGEEKVVNVKKKGGGE